MRGEAESTAMTDVSPLSFSCFVTRSDLNLFSLAAAGGREVSPFLPHLFRADWETERSAFSLFISLFLNPTGRG